MNTSIFEAPAELVSPDYSIYRYTDQIYKVVYFKRPKAGILPPVRESPKNECKFSQSVSRARKTILELALCNEWKYFITLTLDGDKYDRFNLLNFRRDLAQFVRNLRKKYMKQGFDYKINYLLVPEKHENGAWHIHGLLSDISAFTIPFDCLVRQGVPIPKKLWNKGYFNWPDYQEKFGNCSLGLIRDKIACGFYVTKYISKMIQDSDISPGDHLFFASQGLNRSSLHGDIYGYSNYLDGFLDRDYEFCKTGFTKTTDDLSWDFALDLMDFEPLFPADLPPSAVRVCDDFEYLQDVIKGW